MAVTVHAGPHDLIIFTVPRGLLDGTVPEDDGDLPAGTLGLLRTLYGEAARPPARSDPAAPLARIKTYIEEHLHEPDLGPERIAAAHYISVRYLHKLFEGERATVSQWVRERRLEHCRRDLSDAALAGEPIQRIARRWGFTDANRFSRLFSAAYGCPPRRFRDLTAGPVTGRVTR